MKRLVSILLLITFLFSAIGVVASSITCNMKEMKSKMCCSRNNADCCQKEVKLIKLKDDFVSPPNQKIARPIEFAFISFSPLLTETHCILSEKVMVVDDHAPPLSAAARLTLIQSFLI